jgi:hypothetical protein
MVRTAQPDPKAAQATPAELLDRTGIIAASLPQRRRVELGPKPEPAAAPVAEVSAACPKDADLRPREVVIRRRSRGWLAAGAAFTLLGIGWLGGGVFGVGQVDNAATTQAEVQQNVATQPVPVPAAAEPAPVVQPVVAVPVPVTPKHVVPRHVAAPKASKSAAKPAPAAPRVDTPAATPTTAQDPIDAFNEQVAAMIQPFMPFMQSETQTQIQTQSSVHSHR